LENRCCFIFFTASLLVLAAAVAAQAQAATTWDDLGDVLVRDATAPAPPDPAIRGARADVCEQSDPTLAARVKLDLSSSGSQTSTPGPFKTSSQIHNYRLKYQSMLQRTRRSCEQSHAPICEDLCSAS
jgi:hypothetical protein